jgi:hypothetical protein
MSGEITYLLAMSCAIPLIAGIFRFKEIDSRFHLFVYMKLLDVLIETFVYTSSKMPAFVGYTLAGVNVYMVLNFVLFLLLVNANQYISRKMVKLLIALALLAGFFNLLYNKSITALPFYYLLCLVSVVMLLICIDILSRQILAFNQKLINNFWFLFSSISIPYNTINLLIFGSYFFSLYHTPGGAAIFTIQRYANVASNIFFTLAVLKIPVKRKVFLGHTNA